jgi:hypothetical protein
VADEAVEQADPDGNQAAECPINLICQLCDDGSCAEPHVEVVDGECGPVTYSCAADSNGNTSSGSAGSGSNGNTSSGSAGSNGPTTPGGQSIPPSSGVECPINLICQLCDDGSCAEPHVEMVDGECGPVTYSCDSGSNGNTSSGSAGSGSNGNTSSGAASPPDEFPPSGATASPPDEFPCSVPAICQLCDDGACATPEVEYKDGKCGAVRFVCPSSIEGSTGEAVDLN